MIRYNPQKEKFKKSEKPRKIDSCYKTSVTFAEDQLLHSINFITNKNCNYVLRFIII